MKKMKRYLILILGVLSFISCGKFLEEFSQDLAYAESCTDLDEILIGNGYMEQPLYFAEASRSEERRVGKECRSRWSPYH